MDSSAFFPQLSPGQSRKRLKTENSFVPFNALQTSVVDLHGSEAGFTEKRRIKQFGENWSVYNPNTGRLHVHKSDKQKSAKQELVFESVGGVCSTLTSHSVKFWELRRLATPRELARLQGFPESFKLPSGNASDLFGNAVCVQVAKFCIDWALRDCAAAVETFVDVCSGIGGFHVAASAAGLACAGFSEVKKAAIACYTDNFPDCPALGDLKRATWPKCDAVFAGFPCQPFSRSMQSFARKNHHSMTVSEYLPSIVDSTGAKIVVFENVQSIRALGSSTLKHLVSALETRGFSVKVVTLNAKDFNVPQQRKRIFIVGVLGSTLHDPPDLPPKRSVTIESVLEE